MTSLKRKQGALLGGALVITLMGSVAREGHPISLLFRGRRRTELGEVYRHARVVHRIRVKPAGRRRSTRRISGEEEALGRMIEHRGMGEQMGEVLASTEVPTLDSLSTTYALIVTSTRLRQNC